VRPAFGARNPAPPAARDRQTAGRHELGPDVTRDRLALGQNRHGGVVAMQPLAASELNLTLDARV